MRRRLWTMSLAMLVLIPLSLPAAPTADVWERWTKNDPDSRISVDHTAWDRFLKAYVVESADGINRVRYGQVRNEDRKALEEYLRQLEQTPVSRLSRAEQKAYWINFYNALTVSVILDHFPVKSITDIDISPGLFSNGPWKKKLVTVEGEALSLDDIEHRILRPIWQDPRVHYAVNCASLGCPNLQPTAFTAQNTDALLDRAARAYVNHPRGARVRNGRLTVSSIYMWFKEDFGGSDAGIIAHLKTYAEPALKAQLDTVDGIAGDDYDWTLNDATGP
jgi:hypothetical protein